ncbi:MAG: molybdopterin molybdotransferase MoeA [Pirellulales bacterium]|nr:molybdopterin molybdotransferase MoeA [Pirellulales bacterium]
MLTPEAAFAKVLEVARPLPPRRVTVREALGLVLAEPISADRDYPPFPRAMMDGYAVRFADAGRTVPVAGEIAAGRQVDIELADGSCIEIMTGACCPPGTQAVVQKEHVRREGDAVALPAEIAPGQHIASAGSECRRGQEALPVGTIVSPLAAAVLASFGVEIVPAIPRPSLATITTGSELAAHGEQPTPVQIRDSNGPMLAALAAEMGIDASIAMTVPDRFEDILDALAAAAEKDLVLIAGGVSVGTYDYVPRALERFGAETIFHRVAQKPGKPLLLARKGGQLIFGLPGNPLGCHLGFHRYVAAAIRRMEGKPPAEVYRGRLLQTIRPKTGRAHFVPAQASWSNDGWQLQPQPGVSSADVFHAAAANCYLHIPPGPVEITQGNDVEFSLFSC